MTPRFKTILSVGAIFFVGGLSRANAQTTPSVTYYETRNHCKLIDHQSRVVINYRDTLQIYGLDTIDDGAQRKIVCDLGDGHSRLIYDMNYYMRRNWMPEHPIGDTGIARYSLDDAVFAYMYKFYDRILDDHRRDSVERLLLDNRYRALEYIKQIQK